MGYPIKQSQTAVNLVFGPMILASDHISAATGKTVTVTLSKNGAAPGAAAGAVSEVGNGYYMVAANATDANTLGALILAASATGCDPFSDSFFVVAYDPLVSTNLGLSALPTAAAGANGGLPLGDASGRVDLGKWLGATVDAWNLITRVIRSATATAGGANSITLDAGASATDNAYTGMTIRIISGTGAGQVRGIYNYVGATKQAVPNRAWATNPDNTSVFLIYDDLTAAETVFGNQQRYLTVDGSGNVTVGTNNDKTGYALTLAEEAAIATAVAQRAYEGGLSLENIQRITLAAVAGLSNSHQLGTPKYRDVANSKNRIAATTDANGNRTAMSLDGS